MVPDTWVPCQLESLTPQPAKKPEEFSAEVIQSPGSWASLSRRLPSLPTWVSLIMSYPATKRPARSAWSR
ncbi:MAG: hypothetical protein R2746_00750 [Acidimicrobiales bacterium]